MMFVHSIKLDPHHPWVVRYQSEKHPWPDAGMSLGCSAMPVGVGDGRSPSLCVSDCYRRDPRKQAIFVCPTARPPIAGCSPRELQ